MIATFRDARLRSFFIAHAKLREVPADIERRLFRKLQMIDDATKDADLRIPPSNHFEKLRGPLEGYQSVRVNKRWRLVFRWDDAGGEASDLYLDDHTYR